MMRQRLLATRFALTCMGWKPNRNIHVSQLLAQCENPAYEQFGNREIVGHGMLGAPAYVDRFDIPYPAIRFKEDTPEINKLQEKEKGDWKNLSLDEKKALYRHSFCQTLTEMDAPTGEWKLVLSGVFAALLVAMGMVTFVKKFVYMPMPISMSDEWRHASLQKMIDQHMEPVTGYSAKWDYEKSDWKR